MKSKSLAIYTTTFVIEAKIDTTLQYPAASFENKNAMYFIHTKQELDHLTSSIEIEFSILKETPPNQNPWKIKDNFFELKLQIQKAVHFNHLIIAQLHLLKQSILNGSLNQRRRYRESDLNLSKSIFESFYQHVDLDTPGYCSSFKLFFKTLREQIKQISEYVHYFPEDLAINVLLPLSEMSDLELDLYQTAHLGLQYSLSQLKYITLFTKMQKVAADKNVAMN